MFRRTLVLAGVLGLACSCVASAADVKIRVEGNNRTIFAPGERAVTANDALTALEGAAVLGEFYYHVTQTSFGPYVDQIGLFPSAGSAGWVYKVNGVSPPVGADQYVLHDGDHVLWYYALFGPAGGPPTLELRRVKDNCYRVFTVQDAGTRTAATGAVLHVGSKRTVATRSAAACVGRHRGLLVRATLEGAVRSNALP